MDAREAPAGQTMDELLARLERLPFSRRHLRIASLLGTGTFFDAFDSLLIASALTVIVTALGINFVNTGLIISAAYIGQFVGAIVFGYLAERYGRKLAYVLALAGFGAFSIAIAFAWDFHSLFWLRLLQGIGLGAEVPVAGTLFNEFVRGRSRGLVVMLYESLFAWGILLAPLVSLAAFTVFGEDLGWRAVFILGGLPVLIAVVAYFRLPESPRWLAAKGRIEEAEEVVRDLEESARGQVTELERPVVHAQSQAKSTRLTELFSPDYRQRTILSWAQWFCTYYVVYGYTVWLPTLYVQIGGLPVSYSLALTVVSGVVSLAMTYVFAFTVDRIGRKPWFVSGFGLAAAGALVGWALVVAFGITTWPVLFAIGLAISVGAGFNAVGVYVYTPELFPTRMRAWATSVGSSLNRLGSLLAPVAVGGLLGANLGLGAVFAMFGLVALVGMVVMAWLGIETKQRVLEDLAK